MVSVAPKGISYGQFLIKKKTPSFALFQTKTYWGILGVL